MYVRMFVCMFVSMYVSVYVCVGGGDKEDIVIMLIIKTMLTTITIDPLFIQASFISFYTSIQLSIYLSTALIIIHRTWAHCFIESSQPSWDEIVYLDDLVSFDPSLPSSSLSSLRGNNLCDVPIHRNHHWFVINYLIVAAALYVTHAIMMVMIIIIVMMMVIMSIIVMMIIIVEILMVSALCL